MIDVSKTKWDLSELEGDFEEQRKVALDKVESFASNWKEREDYLEKPEVLKEALDEYEKLLSFKEMGAEAYYYGLKTVLDMANPECLAKENQVDEFVQKLNEKIQFFGIRISKIEEEKQKEFLEFEGLKDYKHYLEKIFKKAKHTLSESEERIMMFKSSVSEDNWIRMVQGLLNKQEREVLVDVDKKEKKSFAEILGMVKNSKKEVRKSVGEVITEVCGRYAEVAENEINSILQNKKINDELRAYKRPDESRHLRDDIDTEVVDVLVDTVTKSFDISKRFYELRAKLVGEEKIEYYDRLTPFGNVEKEYDYKETVELTYKVFKNLDEEFGKILKGFVEGGKIDVYPKKGKRNGAACFSRGIVLPTYFYLNHAGSLMDVKTLAHEAGHGINNELIRRSQNGINFGTPLSTAEVASTFMEDFVYEELMKDVDDETRLSLLIHKLDDDIATIFRQIALYNMETELHRTFREKGYVSKEEIGEIFKKNMKSYLGDSVNVEGFEDWWVYWNHIRYLFYVYSYASGLLISKTMQRMVREDKKNIRKVKEFLSAGTSKSPSKIFLDLGIDIEDKSFWENGLKEVSDLLKETENLAKKLGKI